MNPDTAGYLARIGYPESAQVKPTLDTWVTGSSTPDPGRCGWRRRSRRLAAEYVFGTERIRLASAAEVLEITGS